MIGLPGAHRRQRLYAELSCQFAAMETSMGSFLKYMEKWKGDPRLYAEIDGRIQFYFTEADGNMHLHVDPEVSPSLKNCDSFFELLDLYLTTKVFGGGPKVFRPSSEQLKLLGEMTLNVPFGEYTQPFETVVIEFPADFCDTLVYDEPDKHVGARPLFSVLHHKDSSVFHSVYTDADTTLKSWWRPDRESELETWLEREVPECSVSMDEARMEARVRRCALAYALLIDEVGVKKVGPAQPARVDAWRRTVERRPDLADGARKNIRAHPVYYELDQKVTLHRTVKHRSELGEPTGGTMPPHHRRGFYKMQPHGPKNSLRKRVRIPPVFVNAHLFLGSMADARAQYA